MYYEEEEEKVWLKGEGRFWLSIMRMQNHSKLDYNGLSKFNSFTSDLLMINFFIISNKYQILLEN